MSRPSRAEVVATLRASQLLREIPEKSIEELADRALYKAYESGSCIFRQDDESKGMMVVLSGRVKITSGSPSGTEVILNVIDPGQVFGEMALLDGAPRCADAFAPEPTETLSLLRRDFLPILDRHPEAARGMMSILCDRIRQATSFVEAAVFLPAPQRIFRRIQALADQYGEPQETGSICIKHGFSQQELGDSVGLTRVSVNRQLADWRNRKLINYSQGTLEVLDMDALEDASLDL